MLAVVLSAKNKEDLPVPKSMCPNPCVSTIVLCSMNVPFRLLFVATVAALSTVRWERSL